MTTCPLCGGAGQLTLIPGPAGCSCTLCQRCGLIFKAPSALPDVAAERTRYLLHENSPEQPGYVAFLNQAIAPTLPHLRAGMRGLDYGCGPTPTLSVLLARAGYPCAVYDPFFFPDLPEGPFDFLFATEVVEHFHRPGEAFRKMVDLVRPGGLMTLMTDPWTDLAAFPRWGYAMDPTHVAFYNTRTIDYICEAYGLQSLDRTSPRVSVLRRV